MQIWLMWLIAGAIMMLVEFVVPGGIIVFLGFAALLVGIAIHYGLITTVPMAFLAWFMLSILCMFFLRGFFIKYFEGDSQVQNVDEDLDLVGGVVFVTEDIFPYKEGRVKFRDSTWTARSDFELISGSKAVIFGKDGNHLLVKPI